jgi:hypothetical protein
MADYNSSLPIRTEADGDVVTFIADSTTPAQKWAIDANGAGSVTFPSGTQFEITDGTDTLAINTDGSITSTITDGTDTLAINTDGTIGIGDGTNALAIGANGEVTALISDGTDTLAISTGGAITSLISDGTDTLAVNTDGSINVNVVTSTVGTEFHLYGTTSGGVPNTPSTVVTHTTTALKTFLFKEVGASCSGKCKVEVKTGTPSSETTKAVFFLSSSNNNETITFAQPIEVAAGDNTLVVMTNRDNANADLYAFINGNEV